MDENTQAQVVKGFVNGKGHAVKGMQEVKLAGRWQKSTDGSHVEEDGSLKIWERRHVAKRTGLGG